MEIDDTCPKFAKCPIYQKNTFFNERAGKTYRNIYCHAGKDMYSTCKRFITAELMGKPAPDSVMPNSILTIEQIVAKMKA